MSLPGFKKNMKGFAFPALIALACLVVALTPSVKQNDATYTFVDVGQGDCLHIRTQDGRNYLMDGGGKFDYNVGKNILAPYLLKNGVSRLDGVFVSHLHMDHFKGLAELAACNDVGPVYVYDGYRVNEEAVLSPFWDNPFAAADEGEEDFLTGSDSCFSHEDIRYLAAGDVVLMGKYSRAETLYPIRLAENEYEWILDNGMDENRTSLIVRFETEGVSVLMTGDVSQDGEMAALSISDLDCDILKIGHHGSKTSTSEALLEGTNPEMAVIQVGKNSFGHPTSEVLEKLEFSGIPVYRNDESGAVLIDPSPGGFTVKTVKRDFVSPVLFKACERP